MGWAGKDNRLEGEKKGRRGGAMNGRGKGEKKGDLYSTPRGIDAPNCSLQCGSNM